MLATLTTALLSSVRALQAQLRRLTAQALPDLKYPSAAHMIPSVLLGSGIIDSVVGAFSGRDNHNL
jgi:hypothetical protein